LIFTAIISDLNPAKHSRRPVVNKISYQASIFDFEYYHKTAHQPELIFLNKLSL